MPRYHYLQNRLATSSFLLPVAACIGIALWLADGMSSWKECGSLLTFLLATALMLELNNTHALLRVRSRSVSATFCLIAGYSQFVHADQVAMTVVLCLLLSYHFLFHTYQNSQPTGKEFSAFLCIGTACLIQPWLVILAIPLWLAFWYFTVGFSFHDICAMLVGLILPSLFVATGAFLTDMLPTYLNFWQQAFRWDFSDYQQISLIQLADALFLIGLTLASGIHFMLTSYQDKIKTRVFLTYLNSMCILFTGMLVALPAYFNTIYLALCITACPLIGHAWTFSSGKWVNYFFYLILVLTILLAIVNLWMPSFNF